tara:strand:- start:601 stop:1530 length:930 start_codon:yes stop_codon:yes gene_type:complete
MKLLKPKFWDSDQFSLLSILLLPITFFIKLINAIRKLLSAERKCSIPIICVGNIYLGGTGKTPFCIELFSILKNLNKNPAFIRKKYDSFTDEIRLLSKTGKVYEGKKRLEAIDEAIKNKIDVAVLDDGFQDFSFKKDISIICFNEKQWIGNGFEIPSGPLREGLSSLKRAQYVVINGEKNTDKEKKIFEKNNKIKIFYNLYKVENINEFKNKKIIAFAGIGNPGNFFDILKKNEINLIEEIYFPDHYNYPDKDIENLMNKAKNNNATLLTTEKDYLRINEKHRKDFSFLRIKSEIKNKSQFVQEIKKLI